MRALAPARIRPARPEEAPKILAMLAALASFEGAAHPPRLSQNSLARDVFASNPKLQILITEDEMHTFLGILSYFENYSTWEGEAGIHITDLWVEPEARGQGVGEALLRHVISLHERKRIDLFVLRNNTARMFYERLGFTEQKEWCLYRRNADPIDQQLLMREEI
jgi:ribosomal protein S18 acetylase RimI-like enzyme